MRTDEDAPATGSKWSVLLRSFSEDPGSAAAEYERLRTLLVAFFRRRGQLDPDELADRVFDRYAEKLAAGESVEKPGPYALGIARFIHLETVKSETRARKAIENQAAVSVADPADNRRHELRLRALETCMAEFEAAERERILRYHAGSGRDRIATREAMAETLQITQNSLRIQMFRARTKLEECVSRQLG